MSANVHNDKLPKDAYNVDDTQTFYADNYWTYRSCPGGTHHIEHRDPQSKYNHDMENYPDGSFYHRNQNGGEKKDEYTADFTHQHNRTYVSNGYSRHCDGHTEKCHMKTYNAGTGGERYVTTANNRGHGSSGDDISLVGGHVAHVTAKCNNVESAGGEGISMSSTVDSQQSHHADSNHTKTNGNTHYGIFGEDHGSYGMANVDHAANNSMQQQALNGNVMITAQKGSMIGKAAQEINLNCGQSSSNIHMENSKITLTVGGSSITIEDGKITLKASQIILDGETHCGGQGGQPAGKCGGGCANKTFVN